MPEPLFNLERKVGESIKRARLFRPESPIVDEIALKRHRGMQQ